MKQLFFILISAGLVNCSSPDTTSTITSGDTVVNIEPSLHEENSDVTIVPQPDTTLAVDTVSKQYANARFKDVAVRKMAEHTYRITGKAQIFEASFSWVVEDGHNEIAQGHNMTDAGAPEWGNFDFTIEVQKKRANSSLTLLLFEISAKDGSRVHELPIPLP